MMEKRKNQKKMEKKLRKKAAAADRKQSRGSRTSRAAACSLPPAAGTTQVWRGREGRGRVIKNTLETGRRAGGARRGKKTHVRRKSEKEIDRLRE